MASQLTPCPSCSRHVKVGPASCPFCGGAVPVDVPARAIPVGRPLSRAALLFAGAATVTACSSSTTAPTPPKDAGVDTGHGGAADGALARDAGKPADDRDAGKPADDAGDEIEGGVTALYGVMVIDASMDEDSGHGIAAYGGPVHGAQK